MENYKFHISYLREYIFYCFIFFSFSFFFIKDSSLYFSLCMLIIVFLTLKLLDFFYKKINTTNTYGTCPHCKKTIEIQESFTIMIKCKRIPIQFCQNCKNKVGIKL